MIEDIKLQTLKMVKDYALQDHSTVFFKEGLLYVYAQDIAQWLQKTQGFNCSTNEFRRRYLAKAGFISVQIRDASGTKRYYWRIPLDKIERAEELTEAKPC